MTNLNYVWEATLDNKYHCSVSRTGDYTGKLKVIDTEKDSIILDKEVGLSYQAMFGPDVDDVRLWEDLSIEAVDKK